MILSASAKKVKRKVEKWSDIVSGSKLDLSKPINFVTAKQIKQIVHEEPRLMAKMDSLEDLPSIFRENGVFLLPINRQQYLIVRGRGYHELEGMISKPEIYPTSFPFPTSAEDVESEGVYLDYAYSSGILSSFTGLSNLHLSLRGRRTTPQFSFGVNRSVIQVDGAQIEVDVVYENIEQIASVEAKIGMPNSFSIRQLYYPFRTFRCKKPVRNLFFSFEPAQKMYLLCEYEFSPYTSFESIRMVQYKQYQIKLIGVVSIQQYQNVLPASKKIDIPQADYVNKIIQFPYRVFEGYDTSEKMIEAFGFVRRQSSYYRQAAEILGFVVLH